MTLNFPTLPDLLRLMVTAVGSGKLGEYNGRTIRSVDLITGHGGYTIIRGGWGGWERGGLELIKLGSLEVHVRK